LESLLYGQNPEVVTELGNVVSVADRLKVWDDILCPIIILLEHSKAI